MKLRAAISRLVEERADSATYANLLQQCGIERALSYGKTVHAHIVKNGYARNTYIGNLLMQMYGKCGDALSSRSVFNDMAQRNVFSWSIMIAAYTQNGYHEQALVLYEQMDSEKIQFNKVTLLNVLAACLNPEALSHGKKIHLRIVAHGFDYDVVMGTSLVNMYSKCGSIKDAKCVFDTISQKDIIAWNAMLAAFAHHKLVSEMFKLYRRLFQEGIKPNNVTYASVLGGLSSSKVLTDCKEVQKRAVSNGYELNVVVQDALVGSFARCGSVKNARSVFEGIRKKNVGSWSRMIGAYVQQGECEEALTLYHRMCVEDVEPNNVTYLSVLAACSRLVEGKKIHCHITTSGLDSDIALGTALVSMYIRCGSLDDARRKFDAMQQRDVLLWNIMISVYVQYHCNTEALELYRKMDVQPNSITFTSILGACCSYEYLAEGKAMHARISGNVKGDVVLDTALLSMYIKCSASLSEAKAVFDNMQKRDLLAWNLMIAGYSQHGEAQAVQELYKLMKTEQVEPDSVTYANVLGVCCVCQQDVQFGKEVHCSIVLSGLELDVVLETALINMYASCGSVEHAKSVFDEMPCRDVVAWTSMMGAYAHAGQYAEAIELLRDMIDEKVEPNEVTFATVIGVCSSMGNAKKAKEIYDEFIAGSKWEDDILVQNGMLYMYAKCGNLEEAKTFFDGMREKDVASWTVMIAVYAHNGQCTETLELHWAMELLGVQADGITFVSILYACSHAGLVEQGWRNFGTMMADHSIEATIEHYVCMTDLLGRAGRLRDAEDLIQNMPFESEIVSWSSLLGCCRIHSDLDRGLRAAEHLVELVPHDSLPYVLLANIYAECKERTLMTLSRQEAL